MKNLKNVAKRIKEICPFSWAKYDSIDEIERTIGCWLKEDNMWEDVKWNSKSFSETGGFRFKISKSGKRYIETVPQRIWID